jgi:hypothetical protein
LCAAHILAYPQPGERFIVDTDASNFGIGGVLSQVQDIVKAGNTNCRCFLKTPCQGECTHCHKVELRADIKHVGAISALPAAEWDPLVLRTEQVNDTDIGPILQEVETGRRPEWKDIADRSPPYKSYWAQWKSLAVRNGVLKRNWESANGRSKVAQIVLPLSKVEDVLTELHGGPSRRHLGVNKTLNKIRQRYHWLHSRNDVETWCQ